MAYIDHKCENEQENPQEILAMGMDITDLKPREYALTQEEMKLKRHGKTLEEKMRYAAWHDYLTNLPNWYYFQEYLNKICCNAQLENYALMLIDIDNFKLVNDFLGRSAGDKIFIKICNCMKRYLRKGDFIARVGGDEFAVILPDTNLEGAKRISSGLQAALESEAFCAEKGTIPLKITVSIGITMIDRNSKIDSLFSYVAEALLKAKHDGKNRISVLQKPEDKIRVFQNNKMLSSAYDSIRRGNFELHFQPIYKANGDILYYEALVRMKGQNDELIYPSSFISIAERYDFISAIDRWSIENSLKMVANNKSLNVFVNLSGKSFGDETLLKWIESAIEKYGIDPRHIGFEITETAIIRDMQKTRKWVFKLKNLGCGFALDDFGVGFSSFSNLYTLPIDYLKIDGSFIRNLDSDPTKYALVEAMNSVAHTLGMQTIAEFVESETIWKILNDLGVDCGQGYCLGKPSPIVKCNG